MNSQCKRLLSPIVSGALALLLWPSLVFGAPSRPDADIVQAVKTYGNSLGLAASVPNSAQLEGDWAACDFIYTGKGQEGEGTLVLHQTQGRWKVVRKMQGRGGPIERRQWTLDCKLEPLHGCTGETLPSSVVALFGYGTAPSSAVASLRAAARSVHTAPGRYCIATHGKDLFARTSWNGQPAVVWELAHGSWSQIFREEKENVEKSPAPQYAANGLSAWMMNVCEAIKVQPAALYSCKLLKYLNGRRHGLGLGRRLWASYPTGSRPPSHTYSAVPRAPGQRRICAILDPSDPRRDSPPSAAAPSWTPVTPGVTHCERNCAILDPCAPRRDSPPSATASSSASISSIRAKIA